MRKPMADCTAARMGIQVVTGGNLRYINFAVNRRGTCATGARRFTPDPDPDPDAARPGVEHPQLAAGIGQAVAHVRCGQDLLHPGVPARGGTCTTAVLATGRRP
jgi:hypothetical protein